MLLKVSLKDKMILPRKIIYLFLKAYWNVERDLFAYSGETMDSLNPFELIECIYSDLINNRKQYIEEIMKERRN